MLIVQPDTILRWLEAREWVRLTLSGSVAEAARSGEHALQSRPDCQ